MSENALFSLETTFHFHELSCISIALEALGQVSNVPAFVGALE